jgi:hypothetical protein
MFRFGHIRFLHVPRGVPARETPLRRTTSITQDACMSTTGETAQAVVTASTGVAP